MTGVFLTEGDVIAAVVAHLEREGWEIRQVLDVKQRGIDIIAARQGVTLAVEAKGGGSSQQHASRFGKPFDLGQARSHVAKALYAAAKILNDGQHQPAIAVPDDTNHRRAVDEVGEAMRRLRVQCFFAADGGTVRLGNPGGT